MMVPAWVRVVGRGVDQEVLGRGPEVLDRVFREDRDKDQGKARDQWAREDLAAAKLIGRLVLGARTSSSATFVVLSPVCGNLRVTVACSRLRSMRARMPALPASICQNVLSVDEARLTNWTAAKAGFKAQAALACFLHIR